MKASKIYSTFSLTALGYLSMVAQVTTDLPNLNGISLAKVPIVREVPLSVTETVITEHTELMYIPVQYDETGQVVAYDYVEVKVQDPPPPTVKYDTSSVLMAYITLPAVASHGIDKVQFFMGDTPGQGHNLLNTVFHLDGNPNNGGGNGNGNGGGNGGVGNNTNNGNGGANGAQSNTLVEVVNTSDMTIIVLNLGPDLVGSTNYYGEIVLQSNNGNSTPPFPFSINF
jgi:hypothetical protein